MTNLIIETLIHVIALGAFLFAFYSLGRAAELQRVLFALMKECSKLELERFGWAGDQGKDKLFSLSRMKRNRARNRLVLRLLFWGVPNGLDHSQMALDVLQRWRSAFGLAFVALSVSACAWISTLGALAMQFGFIPIVIFVLSTALAIIALRPWSWKSEANK
ncbi:hypothetical protein [Tropicibacter sp. Alg240-R139]|uniref:hypothetical protein n=1 Tax=Tropicibacter sp. Alg240-R139 TaxID=2305991 RepID=UPI0013DF2836|nr:hypothetical protein [Tropicibacter sp. Alg240-R139]